MPYKSEKILKVCQITLARWRQLRADRILLDRLAKAVTEGPFAAQGDVYTDSHAQNRQPGHETLWG